MQLKTEDYHVWYDAATHTLTYQGTLRLVDLEEYTPMAELLSDVIAQKPSRLTLDLRNFYQGLYSNYVKKQASRCLFKHQESSLGRKNH